MTAGDQDTPPPNEAPEPTGADRRAHARTTVLWTGTMAIGDNEVQCTIHDISSGGALLDTNSAFKTNDRILLKVDGLGEVPGRVAWRDGNLVGVAFLVGASYITRMIVTR